MFYSVLLTITVQNINPIFVQWLLCEGRTYTQTDTPFCMISQHLSLVRCHQLPAAQLYRRSIEDLTTVKYRTKLKKIYIFILTTFDNSFLQRFSNITLSQ